MELEIEVQCNWMPEWQNTGRVCNQREVMNIRDCPYCGGDHFGSSECPFNDGPPQDNKRGGVVVNDLEAKALWVRQQLWIMTMKAKRGHLPSCYSIVDILVALYYGGILQHDPERPKASGRDRLIISKGHANPALYPILADRGFFPLEELHTYTEPGSRLGVFANPSLPGIEAISDSLGHGLGIACGMALAAKLDGQKIHRVFVVLGDAELNEGSVWEAAAFAAHYHLESITAIVDQNQLGILGEPIGLRSLPERWQSFGWDVRKVDGHAFDMHKAKIGLMDIPSALREDHGLGKPMVLIAQTVKGKGVSFMEGRGEWHNKIPDQVLQRKGEEELGLNHA